MTAPRPGPGLALALGLGLVLGLLVARAAPAQGWDVPAVPGPEEVAALRAGLEAAPLPAVVPGDVTLRAVAGEPALRRLFPAAMAPPAAWRGSGIVIETGVLDVAALARALPGPGWLDCAGDVCTLLAPVVVRPAAALVVAGGSLRLSQEHGAAIISHGRLYISDATVEAWHLGEDRPAATGPAGRDFRPFIAGLEGGHSLIRRSRLAHLGYQASLAYGLSFATIDRRRVTAHPSADLVGNLIEDVYFGFYSFDADGVNVIGNHITAPHVYGIDPHDDTRNMLIAENLVEGARRSHGIILSRRIHRSAVVRNTSRGSARSGFFIDKASHNVVFAGNLSEANGGDGMVVHESREILLAGNRVVGNRGDGIRIRASFRVGVHDNTILDNGRYGLRIYDFGQSQRPPTAEEAGQVLPVLVRVGANLVAGNGAGGCIAPGADAVVLFEAGEVCTLPAPATR